MSEADTKTREKLSVVPKGHWRCHWWFRHRVELIDGDIRLPDESVITYPQFVSRELADEDAFSCLKGDPLFAARAVYLGAQFFPD